MAKELNEDTTFKLSIKTLGMIAAGMAVLIGGWYSLMQEIQLAKEEPVQVDVKVIKEEILRPFICCIDSIIFKSIFSNCSAKTFEFIAI